ncbi:alpha/beta fold hydrolase [Nocardioides euryhalodurans]|uniref:Alpha/beta hydrolase n=1 Tax=Nocardioides euryhalodurans TaxID=2518370 RepID=A0A4P7GNQ3_9ACTN|nr:alpha/beta hydrolase [Nocardioides euryhalodurans]QBR93589.1 alpha/beta hydrolase [Nocardioides euryhalodurans]
MSIKRRILGAVASAAGVAVAGTAVEVARRRRVIARRGAGDGTHFGSLRSRPTTVVADDGVPLHVEVDECEDSPLTVVFVHGYALTLDCWHFQRAGYRGLVRTVFYDQRSHGRSGRSSKSHATIDQLGHDLRQVLDHVVPDGPVVLVGHSMGGMSIIALAEQAPEVFGDRIVGVGLISTTAGGLDPHRALIPLMPSGLGGTMGLRTVATLARGHWAVDGVRRLTRPFATVVTDQFAFGDDVPSSYVDFVDDMLAKTPFEVIAEFFPSLGALDKFHTLSALGRVPVSVVCGTADKLTSIGHSRKLQARIPGARLLECEGAGHMVILERHEQVNAELDQLLAAAGERVDER